MGCRRCRQQAEGGTQASLPCAFVPHEVVYPLVPRGLRFLSVSNITATFPRLFDADASGDQANGLPAGGLVTRLIESAQC